MTGIRFRHFDNIFRCAGRHNGAAAISPTGFDWLGLILISFVLPAILAPIINQFCRKKGWVKDGDLTL